MNVLLVSDPFKASPLLARQILKVPSATGNPGVLNGETNQKRETVINIFIKLEILEVYEVTIVAEICRIKLKALKILMSYILNVQWTPQNTVCRPVHIQAWAQHHIGAFTSAHGMCSCSHPVVAMLNSFLKTRPFSAQNTSIQRITVNPPCVTMHTLEGQLKTLKIHVDMHCLDSDLLAVKFWEPGMVSHQESQHGTMSSWQACIHAWLCNWSIWIYFLCEIYSTLIWSNLLLQYPKTHWNSVERTAWYLGILCRSQWLAQRPPCCTVRGSDSSEATTIDLNW